MRWIHASVAVCVAATMLAGCGGAKKDKAASQSAAKVNKEEITVHQINFVLQQQRGLKPEQVDGASRQILEKLIDQELAVQKASELKIDRDARVAQMIEAARREIVSRAYLEKLSEGAPKASPEEVKTYFDAHPALFSERRTYSIQELAIEVKPEQIDEVKTRLEAAKDANDFVEYLKSAGLKFGANQAVRAAEQLPEATLATLAKMKDGQAIFSPAPNGAQVVFLAGSRSQPVTLDQARPAIEQFLFNERKRKLVADDLKGLRAAAKIEYVGKYAMSAASAAEMTAAADAASAAEAASAAAAASAAEAAAAARVKAEPVVAPASGVDSNVINKGLGIK